MGTQDKVTLSVRERQALARLQSTLESADPRLAKVLGGQASSSKAREGSGTWSLLRHVGGAMAARRWVGPVAMVAGLALVVGTIPWLVWLSIPGVLLMAVGLGVVFRTVQPFLAAGMAEMAARTANAGQGAARPEGTGSGHEGSGRQD